MISIIVARSKNGVIGSNDDLPWHLSSDLKRFKELTIGHSVIMGRRTFESIVSRLKKPLPDRENIVITRDKKYSYPGVVVVYSPEKAIQQAKNDIFVIGGAQVYAQMLPLVDRLYITEVDASLQGDAFFPELSEDEWREISREAYVKDDKNEYNYSFILLDRIKN